MDPPWKFRLRKSTRGVRSATTGFAKRPSKATCSTRRAVRIPGDGGSSGSPGGYRLDPAESGNAFQSWSVRRSRCGTGDRAAQPGPRDPPPRPRRADGAQAFHCAIDKWPAAVGESFHVVSPAAVAMAGYAETVAGWFGKDARIRFLPWEEWRKTVSEREAAVTWDHIARSPSCSIDKARRLLGYAPRYRSLEAVRESVEWLVANRIIDAPALSPPCPRK